MQKATGILRILARRIKITAEEASTFRPWMDTGKRLHCFCLFMMSWPWTWLIFLHFGSDSTAGSQRYNPFIWTHGSCLRQSIQSSASLYSGVLDSTRVYGDLQAIQSLCIASSLQLLQDCSILFSSHFYSEECQFLITASDRCSSSCLWRAYGFPIGLLFCWKCSVEAMTKRVVSW